MTVEAYRTLVQPKADGAGVAFEKALQVINDFIEQEAARYGVSVTTFAKIMLDDDAREAPDHDRVAYHRRGEPMPALGLVDGRVRSCSITGPGFVGIVLARALPD